MNDEIELDIAAAFGATHVRGQRFAIYIPNKDRDGVSVTQSIWIDKALQLLSRAGGGATAMPPVTGAWLNPESGELIVEEPVIVYSYIDGERFMRHLDELVAFVHELGRKTNQGQIAFEFDGEFFLVDIAPDGA